MSVNEDRRAFFDQLVRDADSWVDHMLATSGERFARTEADKAALRAATFSTIVGFLHSMFVNIDGGGQLADTTRIDIVTAQGESLGPALDELWIWYVGEVGRD
jgi:hypothetical protein